jgi:hypothetical protein
MQVMYQVARRNSRGRSSGVKRAVNSFTLNELRENLGELPPDAIWIQYMQAGFWLDTA